MNNPNPFLPQGAFLDQKDKARTRLKIAVISSISLSVVVLMVLLIQGCKKPNDGTDTNTGLPPIDTNASATQLSSNPPPDTGSASNSMAMTPPPVTNPTPMVNPQPPVQPPITPPPPPVAEGEEYTIVKGDTFATIGAAHGHISAAAIQAANPGVDPRKLKIGQKIKLPAPASTQSTSASPMSAPMGADSTSAGGVTIYTVKSGDTLTTIAKKYHGVTIKSIQQANNLTTTAIKVGQKLKIPGGAAPAPAPVETTPPPAMAPVPAPAAAPVSTSAPAPMH